jgi:hypothetical protein
MMVDLADIPTFWFVVVAAAAAAAAAVVYRSLIG